MHGDCVLNSIFLYFSNSIPLAVEDGSAKVQTHNLIEVSRDCGINEEPDLNQKDDLALEISSV